MKRRSPSATRRSRRMLRHTITSISSRILKFNFNKSNFNKLLTPFVFKKKQRAAVFLNPINSFLLLYSSKICQKKNKINFLNTQHFLFLPKDEAFFFYKKINFDNNPFSSFYDFIESRIDFNFTHALSGFMYISDKIDITPLSEEYIFHTKKLMHSFLFKNDLQNFIIKKHLKSSSNPIFSNFSFTRKSFFFILNRDVDLIADNDSYFEKTHFNLFAENEAFLQKNKKSFFEFNSKLF